MYSLKFDPLRALTNEKIIAATTSWPVAPPVDNMAKAKLLYLEEIGIYLAVYEYISV